MRRRTDDGEVAGDLAAALPQERILSRNTWALPLILCLAVTVRVFVVCALPSLNVSDENYQLYEQGHRLAFGYGVKPWEFDDGIRSLVVPYALAGLFRMSEPYFGGPQGYIRFAQITIGALSLAPVIATFLMGRRISSTHAIVAGLVSATWFEIVYFSTRPLTEALAADFIVVGLSVASVPGSALSPRRLAVVGLCLATTVMLRVHLLPGVAVAALLMCRFDIRRWAWLAWGAAPALALFGMVDWMTWGAPFASYFRAIWMNLGQGKPSQFGVAPAFTYFLWILGYWNIALAPIIMLAARRAKSSSPWIGFAMTVIAVHSLIPHKEYRYIYPALACLVVVASLGAADFIENTRGRLGSSTTGYLTGAVVGAWLVASAALAVSPFFASYWVRARTSIQASYWLSRRPNLCGLGLYDDRWVNTGGYAFLHRNVPIYPLRHDHGLAERGAPAFNFVTLKRTSLSDFQPAYRLRWCASDSYGETCVAERQGPCATTPGLRPLLDQHRLGEPGSE